LKYQLSDPISADQCKLIGFIEQVARRTVTLSPRAFALSHFNKTTWLLLLAQTFSDILNPSPETRLVVGEALVISLKEIFRATTVRPGLFGFYEALGVQEAINLIASL